VNDVRAKVRCYACGRRVPAAAAACARCNATFQSMCPCAAVLSVFDEQCAACGAAQIPKRLPRSKLPHVRAAKWGLLTASVGATAWLAFSPRPVAAWRLKAEGRDAFGVGDFQTAAQKFRAVTEQTPGDADAWYSLAVAYRRLGFPADAYRPLAEKAVLVAPDHVAARDLLARTELALGHPDKAFEHAAAAVRAASANGAAWQLLAEVELAGPQPDLARVQNALETARAAGQDTPEVRVMLAEVCIRLNGAPVGRPERLPPGFETSLRAALSSLDAPRSKNGDPALYAARRARIELALGRADDAFSGVDAALARLPKDAPPETSTSLRLLRAMARFARGERPQAMTEFASVLRGSPDASTAASAGSFLAASGEPDLARALLSGAAESGDPRGDVHAVLAGVLLSQGDAEGAAGAIAAARSASPENALFAEIDGAACAARGRFDAARAAFSDAVRAAPRLVSPRVRVVLLDAAKAEGTPDADAAVRAAVVELQTLRKEHGDDPLLLEALGRLHLAAGDVAAARAVLARAAEEAPADAAVWVRLAEACRRSGGDRAVDDAAAAYDRARRLRPDDASIAVAAATLRLTAGDAAGAADVCGDLLRRRPDDASTLRVRAQCLRHLQMWGAAAQDFARLRALSVATEDDVTQWVDSLYRAGDASAAREADAAARGSMSPAGAEELDLLAAIHSGDAETEIAKLRQSGGSVLLAAIQFGSGRIDDAAETLRRIRRARPGDPVVARLLVASLLAAERPPAERIAEARAVLAALEKPSPPGCAEFVEGRILLAEGDASAAVARLRAAGRALPADPLVALYLGEALFATGERDESLASLRLAASLPGAPPSVPRIVAVHLYRASLDARDADRAESLAVEALRYDATVFDAAFRAIAFLHARGRFVDAAELAQRESAVVGLSDADVARLRLSCANDRLCAGDFEAVQSMVETFAPARRVDAAGRLLCAFADAGARRFDEAERAFAAVLDAEPACAPAVVGRVLVDLGRGESATALARVAAWRSTRPDERDVTIAASILLARAGLEADAARLAEECAKGRPSDSVAARHLSAMLRRAGRPADAVAAARRFLERAPSGSETDARLAVAEVSILCRIDLEDAVATVRAVAADASASTRRRVTAAVIEAEALSAMARWSEAETRACGVVAALAESSDRGPASRRLEARARFVVGYVAAQSSPPRRGEAVEQFSKCLELDPLNAEVANDLAWVLAQSRDTAKRALDLAQRATTASPRDASYWDTRAAAADRAGDPDDADASWRKALILQPRVTKDDLRRRAEYALRYASFLRDRAQNDAARAIVECELGGPHDAAAETELRRFLDDRR
jgi:tetratricopeptide (TPR) repeat protein